MGEDLYELPEGWVWAFLCELGELNRGKSKHRPRDDKKLFGGKYPFIQTGEVKSANGLIKTYTQTYSEFGLAQSRLWYKNTLCITIAANIAETALLGIKACFPDSIVGFVADDIVCDVNYVHYFIKSIRSRIDSYAPATAQKNINLDILKKVTVPLPPLLEQQRIVTKIEELFTQLDAGVELLKKVKAKLKRYRQAVLKAAVEGNLTQEWREANKSELEPASVLLERILKQRQEKWEAEQLAKMKAQGKTPKDDSWKSKYKEPIAPDTSNLPNLPDGWCWVSVEQVINVGTGATPLKNNIKYYQSGSIPWVTSGALNQEFVTEAEEYITEIAIEETNAKIFPKHTLLVAMYGEGKTRGKVSELLIEAATNQACAALIFPNYSSQLKTYTKVFFQKNYNDIRYLSSGGVQPNLNLGIIKATVIPLPSWNEQQQIIEAVERIKSVIDQLEKAVDINLKRAEKLRQSILKQAFEGKLLPQNQNDEPAEKLLERIKVEKARREVEKKPKSKTTSKKPRKLKDISSETQKSKPKKARKSKDISSKIQKQFLTDTPMKATQLELNFDD